MKQIGTYLGTEYINQVMQNILEILQIEYKTSTENEFIRMSIYKSLNDWDTWSKYDTHHLS